MVNYAMKYCKIIKLAIFNIINFDNFNIYSSITNYKNKYFSKFGCKSNSKIV